MNGRTKIIHIDGVVGQIEMSIDLPDELKNNPDFLVRGLALVAHPHPLMGGTMDNKVAQTMARAFNQLGYVSVRPNKKRKIKKSNKSEENPENRKKVLVDPGRHFPVPYWPHLPQLEASWSLCHRILIQYGTGPTTPNII